MLWVQASHPTQKILVYIKDVLVSHVILSMMPEANSKVRKKMSNLYLQNKDMLEYV